MNAKILNQEKKNILELAYLEDGKIRLSLSESHGQGPIAFYQETEIAIEKIDGLVREIIYYLNRINILKNPDQHLLRELKKSCQLLYNELLSQEIKIRLQNTQLKNLELIVDEQLVHIPWELLFDGQKFLCEQFSMGRQVRTKGSKIRLTLALTNCLKGLKLSAKKMLAPEITKKIGIIHWIKKPIAIIISSLKM